MNYAEFLARLADGRPLTVRCPDGEHRKVVDYNPDTGDVMVAGWSGDAWIDASGDHVGVEFDPLP